MKRNRKRRSSLRVNRLENLEQRQLLAGDIGLSSESEADHRLSEFGETGLPADRMVHIHGTNAVDRPISLTIAPPWEWQYGNGAQLVAEHEGMVYVVDVEQPFGWGHWGYPYDGVQSGGMDPVDMIDRPSLFDETLRNQEVRPVAVLHVFERVDDGATPDGAQTLAAIDAGLRSVGSVPLDFQPSKILIQGDQVWMPHVQDSIHWFAPGGVNVSKITAVEVGLAEDGLADDGSAEPVFTQTTLRVDGHVSAWSLLGEQVAAYVQGDQPWWINEEGSRDELKTFVLNEGLIEPVESIAFSGWSSVQFLDSSVIISERPHFDVRLAEDDLIALTVEGNGDDPAPVTLNTRYNLVDGTLVAGDSIQTDVPVHLQVDSDGQSAVAVAGNHAGETSELLIVDLADGGMKLFESVPLGLNTAFVAAHDEQHAVLRDYRTGNLLIVNTDMTIDVEASSRVMAIEAAPDFFAQGNMVVLDDLVVSWAIRNQPAEVNSGDEDADEETPAGEETGLTPGVSPISESVLVARSLSSGEVVSEVVLESGVSFPWSHQLELIDSEERSFAFGSDNPEGNNFFVASLDENDAITIDSRFKTSTVGRREVTQQSLFVITSDELTEYRWDDVENPISYAIGEPDPPPFAEDDRFELMHDGDVYVLDVLQNDRLLQTQGHWSFVTPQIVELTGAPEGVEILNGNRILIPGSVTERLDSFEFEYTVQRNGERSTAKVEVEVERVSDEQIASLEDIVKQDAAERLGISSDEIQITSSLFHAPRLNRDAWMPLASIDDEDPAADSDSDAGIVAQRQLTMHEYWLQPRVHVEFTSAAGFGSYVIGMDETIYSSRVRRTNPPLGTDPLIALELRATDASGNTLESVTVGQTFFLEIEGEDLRETGRQGIFSAYLDLQLPDNQLAFTGMIVFGENYSELEGFEISDHLLDEFAAIGQATAPDDLRNQTIARLEVVATGEGDAVLRLDPPESQFAEFTLYGRDVAVPLRNVQFGGTSLSIQPVDPDMPMDTNGDNRITAIDALQVINFLSDYGTTSIDNLSATVRAAGENAANAPMDADAILAMARLDTNRSGSITALDALVIINELNRTPGPDSDEVPAGESLLALDEDTRRLRSDDDQRGEQLF